MCVRLLLVGLVVALAWLSPATSASGAQGRTDVAALQVGYWPLARTQAPST